MATGCQLVPLISGEESPETLTGCGGDEQVGRQTDRRTNAPGESRQMHRQRLDGSVGAGAAGDAALRGQMDSQTL